MVAQPRLTPGGKAVAESAACLVLRFLMLTRVQALCNSFGLGACNIRLDGVGALQMRLRRLRFGVYALNSVDGPGTREGA